MHQNQCCFYFWCIIIDIIPLYAPESIIADRTKCVESSIEAVQTAQHLCIQSCSLFVLSCTMNSAFKKFNLIKIFTDKDKTITNTYCFSLLTAYHYPTLSSWFIITFTVIIHKGIAPRRKAEYYSRRYHL